MSTSTTTTTPITASKAATKTFTLNDLAKIALGAPELTREHLSVLQSLLIILLRKLNCHNETVRIHGFPATCLQKLLDQTSANTEYDFKTQTLDGFKEKYELLEKLEHRTEDVQAKLEKHFQQIRNCYKTYLFNAELWEYYAGADEDLCTYYMAKNKDLCLLFKNSIFNKELRRRATYPVIERIYMFETKIEQMQKRLQELTEQINEAVEKLSVIKYLIQDIEQLRPRVDKYIETFREAMAETQEMLNCKLERVALPAIRKYLDERFLLVHEHLKTLMEEAKRCDPWHPVTIEESTCLSCARIDELQYLRDFTRFKKINEQKKCLCNNFVRKPTVLEKLDNMVFTSYVMKTSFSSIHLSKQSPRSSKELSKTGGDIQKHQDKNLTTRRNSRGSRGSDPSIQRNSSEGQKLRILKNK